MLKICCATIGAAACWVGASAWGQAGAPTFADYPVASRYQGPGVAPQLRPGTAAWQFRTRIREAATQPPNFAGHYVLAMWGCGAECVSYVIVDVRSGTVYFDDMTVCCWGTAVPVDFEPVYGRLDSRLLVFTGMLSEQGSNTAHYYTFSKGRLMAVPRPYRTK